ncbi:hypothetical protein Pla52n_24530 [Stieleria varia]|uniref:Uncharacterized protein n=1 Tax=Stieleria varia TaxID=2528005 RepID=A0A5C6AWU9_9BACT|nr:hypothetical protein Pla52n_24530 [Stieleria varia]
MIPVSEAYEAPEKNHVNRGLVDGCNCICKFTASIHAQSQGPS